MKITLLVTAGSLSLALGVAGIFLPVLPTTPFLLLAAWFYLRSSERLYNWLLGHRVFGPYIRNYIQYRAVSRGMKVGTLAFLWLALTISIILVPNLYVRVFLAIVGAAVTIHVLALKTPAAEDRYDAGKEEGRVI